MQEMPKLKKVNYGKTERYSFSKLDEKIVIEENTLTSLTDLKEGLMQKLFI